MRWIGIAMAAAGLTALATGCFGGSGTARPTRPPTRVVIQASVGRPAHRPAAVAASCPARARCRPHRVPGVTPREWVLVATRTLTCDPDTGDYARPAAACRALRDFVRLEGRPASAACGCIAAGGRPSAITGRLDGKPIWLTLGPCALCGLPAGAGADARVLLPA